MKKNSLFIILCLLVSVLTFAQNNINDYEYVVVPIKYEFQAKENQYRLNELTKFLLEKENFTVFMGNQELPSDAKANNCLLLFANVNSEKSLFKTKLTVDLKNCRGELVFKSKVGESREKEYKKAFNLALRDAFKSFSGLNYAYNGKSPKVEEETSTKDEEISALKEELKSLKEKKEEVQVKEEASVPVKETPKVIVDDTPKNIEITKKQEETKPLKSEESNIFTAKKLSSSILDYELLDKNGSVLCTLLYSGKEDFYMVEGKNAVVYKINNNWVIAEHKGESLEVKAISIKF